MFVRDCRLTVCQVSATLPPFLLSKVQMPGLSSGEAFKGRMMIGVSGVIGILLVFFYLKFTMDLQSRTDDFRDNYEVNQLTGVRVHRLELTSYLQNGTPRLNPFKKLTVGIGCSDSVVVYIYIRGDVGEIPYSTDLHSYTFILSDAGAHSTVLRTQYDSTNQWYVQRGIGDSTFVNLLLSDRTLGVGWMKFATVRQYGLPNGEHRQALRTAYHQYCMTQSSRVGYVPPP